MDEDCFDALVASGLVPAQYAQQAKEVRKRRTHKTAHLFRHKKLPDDGWSEEEILCLLDELAQMDSNSFDMNCGVGEREGRVWSRIVQRRHFGFSHGIGRSGDLCEPQPKAAGN